MQKPNQINREILDISLKSEIKNVAKKVQVFCKGNTEIKVFFNFKENKIFTCYNMTYKNSHIVCSFKSISEIPLDYLIEEITNYYNLQIDSWTNYHNNLKNEFHG